MNLKNECHFISIFCERWILRQTICAVIRILTVRDTVSVTRVIHKYKQIITKQKFSETNVLTNKNKTK